MATDDDPQEMVYVRLSEHDDSVTPGLVTRQAYDEIWQDKGYVIVDDDEAAALVSQEPPLGEDASPSLEDMTRPQLFDQAKSMGLSVPGNATKASLIEAIQGEGE